MSYKDEQCAIPGCNIARHLCASPHSCWFRWCSSGGPWGAAIGGAAGGIMGAFSDASLKKDVKATGKETATGEKEYTWKWNESAKKRVGKGRLGDKTKGVLAQQVAKDNPKAVGKDKKTGRLMVDYSKV